MLVSLPTDEVVAQIFEGDDALAYLVADCCRARRQLLEFCDKNGDQLNKNLTKKQQHEGLITKLAGTNDKLFG